MIIEDIKKFAHDIKSDIFNPIQVQCAKEWMSKLSS